MLRTRMWSSLIVSGVLAALVIGAVAAQDGTPSSSPVASPSRSVTIEVAMVDVDGAIAGNGTVSQSGSQVLIQITGSGLEPGDHGIHIHEFGVCSPEGEEPFSTAGDHYNPGNVEHGGPQDEDSHAGDLGNLLVDDDGTYNFNVATDKVSLDPGAPNTLVDADGSALLIHEQADDLQTDPSGNSGGRVACGIIHPSSTAGTPTASPAATPDA